MPVPKGVDPAKYDRCVEDVKDKPKGEQPRNAYAVCAAALKSEVNFGDLEKHLAEYNSMLVKGKMKKVTHADPRGVSHSREDHQSGVDLGKALATYNAMFQKANLRMAANPDKDADAELGEDVEHLVEDHFDANAEAEAKEGHKIQVKKQINGTVT
jgi:hypothetical protein